MNSKMFLKNQRPKVKDKWDAPHGVCVGGTSLLGNDSWQVVGLKNA